MAKDIPILFSGAMVRALQAGTKTQTRRIVKPQPPSIEAVKAKAGIDFDWIAPTGRIPHWRVAGPVWAVRELMGREPQLRCPYGMPGDRLWVRETFRGPLNDGSFGYRATHDGPLTWESYTWRPSIHMPRAASRITLEVTGVRVERLQDISREDAIAEGIVQQRDGGWGLADTTHYHFDDPRQSYFSLFEAINGPGSVEANPWLWTIEFRRV